MLRAFSISRLIIRIFSKFLLRLVINLNYKELNISCFSGLDVKKFVDLFRTIGGLKDLASLNLSGLGDFALQFGANDSGLEAFKIFTDKLKGLKHLRTLNLSECGWNGINDKLFELFVGAIKELIPLKNIKDICIFTERELNLRYKLSDSQLQTLANELPGISFKGLSLPEPQPGTPGDRARSDSSAAAASGPRKKKN